MTRVLGVGIMGAGVISGQYMQYAPLFRTFELRSVADIIPERSAARSKQFGVPDQTPEALLANPEVDVVLNLTPPTVHYQVTMAALAAGKHAFSEKPLAVNMEQARDIAGTAATKSLRVGSAPDTFLGGSHQQVRQLVDSGRVGRIVSGTAHVMSRGMEHWHPNPDFFFQPGGGPVLDVGPYYVMDLIQLLGPVRRVTAFTATARAERPVTAEGPFQGTTIKVGTPTTIHGLLEFHSGAVVTIGTSWDVLAHGHHNIELYGTEGSIFPPDPNFFGGDIVVADRTGRRETVAPWGHPLSVPNEPANDRNPPRANYRSTGLADMCDAIANGRPARCGIDVALHAVEVMTSLRGAGERAEIITLTTTCERPAPLGPDEARALLRSA